MQTLKNILLGVEEEFEEKFVNKLQAHYGDGDAWPGEEGSEYWDALKDTDEGAVEILKSFLTSSITDSYEAGVNDERGRIEKALPEEEVCKLDDIMCMDMGCPAEPFNRCLAEVKKIINPKE